MKSRWLLPGSLGCLALATPVQAAQLQTWTLNLDENALEFTAQGEVQPRFQVLNNPERLVIDLPNTVWSQGTRVYSPAGRPSAVRQVRVAQFDATTTRMVVEFNPGQRLNAGQVQVEAIAAGRWRIQLPPQSVAQVVQPANASVSAQAAIRQVRANPRGLFVDLEGAPGQVTLTRSPDRRWVYLDVQDAKISPYYRPDAGSNLAERGVRRIQVSQKPGVQVVTRIALEVDPRTPDWQARTSRVANFGGILLLPSDTPAPATATLPAAQPTNPTPVAAAPTPKPTPSIAPSRPAAAPTPAAESWPLDSAGEVPLALIQPNLPTIEEHSWGSGSFPVENFTTYTSSFGPRWGRFHYGLDLAAPEGSYIRNWWAGRVVDVFNDSGCGTGIVVQSGQWEHIYCHLKGRATKDGQGTYLNDPQSGLNIRVGQWISAGSRIARVGMTGRTTGPHLHWGLKYSGQWIDPALVLREMYAQQNQQRLISRQPS
ncbi:MAG: peptidoglycan DD-metalloendopeptidase family protein [Gloeomargaritaceae cyanobacterium C42_A2020_066]|nr:peptidoglycan DD-metalloendopeptidase family protein [Gloeomargaritaceae cyanobacterium C42_A2020_066]